jgi:hypothetical protein
MPAPIKLGKITFSTLSLPEQLQMSRVIDAVNTLGGYSGEIEIQNHLNLNGYRVKNVGAPEGVNDATPLSTTEAKYSATAIRPKLEGGGEAALRTYMTTLAGDVIAKGPGTAQATVVKVSGITLPQIAGNLELSQLPTAGVSGTVTLAKLTGGGTEGSLTFVNGLLTGFVQPT